MANKIDNIIIDMLRSDKDGNLRLDNQEARYSVSDIANPRMVVGGQLTLDPIDPSDTVAEWWEKVRAQILAKDAADDAAFIAKMAEE